MKTLSPIKGVASDSSRLVACEMWWWTSAMVSFSSAQLPRSLPSMVSQSTRMTRSLATTEGTTGTAGAGMRHEFHPHAAPQHSTTDKFLRPNTMAQRTQDCTRCWHHLHVAPSALSRKVLNKAFLPLPVGRHRRMTPRCSSTSTIPASGCSMQSSPAVAAAATAGIVDARRPPKQQSERPVEPVLLLEGDSYHISRDGKAMTMYELSSTADELPWTGIGSLQTPSLLHSTPPTTFPAASQPRFCLQETYALEHSRKQYQLYNQSMDDVQACHMRPFPSNQDLQPVFSLDLQEASVSAMAKDDASSGGSTGCMTWEASLAMALYFASRPDLLRGADPDHRIIELGSGVGFGGLFVHGLLRQSEYQKSGCGDGNHGQGTSITLTDYNDCVLSQCEENLQRNHSSDVVVEGLDWFDLVEGVDPGGGEAVAADGDGKSKSKSSKSSNSGDEMVGGSQSVGEGERTSTTTRTMKHKHRYDTVLACDCAYRPQDVPVLIEAALSLLKPPEERSSMDSAPASPSVSPSTRDVKNTSDGRRAGSQSGAMLNKHAPTIHMFGPINRRCFQEVHEQLKHHANPKLIVVTEELTLRRYRVPLGIMERYTRNEGPFQSGHRQQIRSATAPTSCSSWRHADDAPKSDSKSPTTQASVLHLAIQVDPRQGLRNEADRRGSSSERCHVGDDLTRGFSSSTFDLGID